jgi:class 3 adenylate cyclase
VLRITGFEQLSEPAELHLLSGVLRRVVGKGGAHLDLHGAFIETLAGSRLTVPAGSFGFSEGSAEGAVRSAAALMGRGEPALELRSELKRLDDRLDLAVGIASGACMMGSFGSPSRLSYQVLGAASERAWQLCERARPGEILADRATSAAAGEPWSAAPVLGKLSDGTEVLRL